MPSGNLFELLEKEYPGMKRTVLLSSAVTINLDYIDILHEGDGIANSSAPVIKEGDEVAIIPPVSSG